jgi:hypothetical protein
VGQGAREEVDLTAAGAPAGINYGWRCWEGTLQNTAVTPRCDPDNDVFPVLERTHSGDGYCAIIGGYVVRDAALGALAGRYLYGDNCQDDLRSAALVSPRTTDDSPTGLAVSGLTSFGEDSCGHVYATSGGGPVYRIDGDAFTPCPEPTPPPAADTRTPAVRITSPRRPRPLRVHGFRVVMSCDEMCGVTATGRVRIAGSKRVYVLQQVTKQLAANKRMKVRLRASKRALRAFRAAFRRHKRVTATLEVTGRDAAGNAGSAKRRVRARR